MVICEIFFFIKTFWVILNNLNTKKKAFGDSTGKLKVISNQTADTLCELIASFFQSVFVYA